MGFFEIPDQTRRKQRDAADPSASVWVSANAGSGKTHVLTQRVMRLLLQGTQPSRILCLTFTKAAAANMSLRVFDRLAEWTRLDDAALRRSILETGALEPDGEGLAEARRLFARTVETPGGLKIQTIHAFCERLLHLFPFEANVPARFEVADDERRDELLARARRETLERARADATLGARVERVAQDCSGQDFDRVLREALALRARLREEWPGGSGEALRKALNLAAGRDEAAILLDMVEGGLDPARWPEIAAFLATGKATDVKRAARLNAAVAARARGDLEACLDDYASLFFIKDGDRAKELLFKPLKDQRPALLEEFFAEQERLAGLFDERRAAAALSRSQALTLLVDAIFGRYLRLKSERAILDFDDLVERTLALLTRSEPSWVLYKLDAGIDHILVDEAQDTSAAQWRILTSLMSEFAVGRGGNEARRTFFAVGDEKQSIFSFQGAAPHMFHEMRRGFEKKFSAGGEAFRHVALTHSFRSAPGVLSAVDAVFGDKSHQRGLVAENDVWMGHEPVKTRLPALVEIWPSVGAEDVKERRDWRLPLDLLDETDPPNRVARRVAEKIARLVAPGSPERVHDDATGAPRPVRPGDVLILARRRGAFFEAMVKALKRKGVPVAGADRLRLGEHIAAQDLVAAGRAALLPQDDLSLACALKSPLVGLDDDDLLALAPKRAGSLYDALAASDDSRHALARERIEAWRGRAALRPFDFYARLLSEDGGRRAFEARLGREAADALDEFLRLALAHEAEPAPSLSCFLALFESTERSVKRDMEAGADMARVMTVHAAKGLEAKVVFLPDACNGLSAQHDPKIFALDERHSGRRPVLWSPRKAEDCAAAGRARARARDLAEDEYRRLLYVALTRAEERLYIAGFHGAKEPPALSWAKMIEATLGADARFKEAEAFWSAEEKVLRLVVEASGAAALAEQAPAGPAPAAPDWLTRRLAPPLEARPPIRPSSALAAADRRRAALTRSRRAGLRAGALVHVLLQYLPAVAPDGRRAAARAFLAQRAADLDEAAREKLVADALGVVEAPELAALYGPNSRAEAALAGTASLPDGGEVAVVGRIDRLAVTGRELVIADYKTGTPPPRDALPQAYVAQMALYRAALAPLWPERAPRLLLIWTEGPRVDALSAAELDAALAALSAETLAGAAP